MKDQSPLLEANEIYRRLEDRAIAESNDLNHRVVHCRRCQRGDFLPTIGSGHPLADILLVKYRPQFVEVGEGVSFFGRSGTAVLKSVNRLGIDPLLVYGTNVVKCAGVKAREGETNCPAYFIEEFHVTQPRIIVVMGEKTLRVVNRHLAPGMKKIAFAPGELQEFTHFCRALVTPDIDDSLDEEPAKAAFWHAFRSLGEWHRDEPPY